MRLVNFINSNKINKFISTYLSNVHTNDTLTKFLQNLCEVLESDIHDKFDTFDLYEPSCGS